MGLGKAGVLEFFHALASLVPPPLVDLRFAHSGSLRDFDDFLARPKQVASSQLALQTGQLLLRLSLSLEAGALFLLRLLEGLFRAGFNVLVVI